MVLFCRHQAVKNASNATAKNIVITVCNDCRIAPPLYKIKYPKIIALIKAQTYKTQYFT